MYSLDFVFSDVHLQSCVIASHATVMHQSYTTRSLYVKPLFDCVHLDICIAPQIVHKKYDIIKYKKLSNGSSSLTEELTNYLNNLCICSHSV